MITYMCNVDLFSRTSFTFQTQPPEVFLEILQNSQENTCARVSFFNEVAGLRPVTLLKKILWDMCFLVNFAKFVWTPSCPNTSGGRFWKVKDLH